jgi:hypothetical protein
MKFTPTDPPRRFDVGLGEIIQLSDCGRVALAPDEQVTFVTEAGAEFDVSRKDWGFYATPSLNGRLQQFDLRAVLVKSPARRFYIFLVERGKEPAFERYLAVEEHRIIAWLDSTEACELVERRLHNL